MINRRGLSVVVASVLLILLTIAAVSVIAGFIIPFVRESLSSTGCVQFRDYFSFEEAFEYNCYDDELHAISMKVIDNSSADKVTGFDLRFLGNGTAKKVSVRNGDAGSCLAGRIFILNKCNEILEVPGSGDYSTITYVYNSTEGSYKKAEVYTVLEDGRVCDMSDSINLVSCKPGINLIP